MDDQVAQYFILYSWLFWPTVHWVFFTQKNDVVDVIWASFSPTGRPKGLGLGVATMRVVVTWVYWYW